MWVACLRFKFTTYWMRLAVGSNHVPRWRAKVLSDYLLDEIRLAAAQPTLDELVRAMNELDF